MLFFCQWQQPWVTPIAFFPSWDESQRAFERELHTRRTRAAATMISLQEAAEQALRQGLEVALWAQEPLPVIASMVARSPRILELVDEEDGWTPLHIACQSICQSDEDFGEDTVTELTAIQVIQFLADAFPEAVAIQAQQNQETPLHLVCNFCADSGVSLPVLRALVENNPKAIGMVNAKNETPLRLACYWKSASLSVVKLMAQSWPASCLVLDDAASTPWDKASQEQCAEKVTELLSQVTAQAVVALVDASSNEAVAMPQVVRAHIAETVGKIEAHVKSMQQQQSAAPPSAATSKIVCYRMDRAMLRKLLQHEELQSLLREERFQGLVCGLIRLNHAGRKHVLRDPGNTTRRIKALSSVADSLDSLFLHLRECPFLCQRDPTCNMQRNAGRKSSCWGGVSLLRGQESGDLADREGRNKGTKSRWKQRIALQVKLAKVQARREEACLLFEVMRQRKELRRLGNSADVVDDVLPIPEHYAMFDRRRASRPL